MPRIVNVVLAKVPHLDVDGAFEDVLGLVVVPEVKVHVAQVCQRIRYFKEVHRARHPAPGSSG